MNQISKRRGVINRIKVQEEIEILFKNQGYNASKRNNIVKILKKALIGGNAEIKKRFESCVVKSDAGKNVLKDNTFLIDQLIRIIFDLATSRAYPAANRSTAEKISLVAIGGYGRGELAPYSDVDIMFLIPYKETPYSEQIIEFILYTLWDMGLKIGHSTRSIDDVIRLSKDDITIRTSVLDSRWLWGDQVLYQNLIDRFRSDVIEGSGPKFVEFKLKERNLRHNRMGDSRYVVEPNIKEGKGGLRDLQTLYWLVKYLFGISVFEQLLEIGIITQQDLKRYNKAYKFLWTVRCHIHFLSKRADERLSFDIQKAIGERMLYTDRAGTSGVERFMKHYFLIAKDVGDLTRVLCAVLEEQQKSKGLFKINMGLATLRRRNKIDGFNDEKGRINVIDKEAFKASPIKLIKIFYEAQKYNLDIHPNAIRLISENLKLVNNSLRNNDAANEVFLKILTAKTNPEQALRLMNEAGVLGKFIPDFGRVVAQMQYDMYHTYTVDEHTIRAIGILSRIENGTYSDDMPNSSEAMSMIQSRRALYVSVFLHDIAKGRGGDHSQIGAEIAVSLGPRLTLSEEETETVVWLVLNHLLMSDTAFKRDVDDPKTVQDFVNKVKSIERLRLLTILTVADIKAVGPKTWNSWKSGLLRSLFQRSLEILSGDRVIEHRKERIEHAKDAFRKRIEGPEKGFFEDFISKGYDKYWLTYNVEVHIRHAGIVKHAHENNLNLHIDVRVDNEFEYTDITVYTQDHPGIFYQIAGAVALSGATIMDAKIVTMSDGMVLDSFSIVDINNQAYKRTNQLDRLKKRIEDVLSGKLNLEIELSKTMKQNSTKKEQLFSVATRVITDNSASTSDTVIEVNGKDRARFLYDVTRALNQLGLKINSAHITTYGEHVVDTFYVKDIFGLKINHKSKLEKIRSELVKAVEKKELQHQEF